MVSYQIMPLACLLIIKCSSMRRGSRSGAITVTQQRVMEGVRFAWPHLRSGLGILTAAADTSPSYNKWVGAARVWTIRLFFEPMYPVNDAVGAVMNAREGGWCNMQGCGAYISLEWFDTDLGLTLFSVFSMLCVHFVQDHGAG